MSDTSDVVTRALERRHAASDPIAANPAGDSGRARLDFARDNAFGRRRSRDSDDPGRERRSVLLVPLRPAPRPVSDPVFGQHHGPNARQPDAVRAYAEAPEAAAGRSLRRRRGERRSDLVHRNVRSRPGAACQQPAGHASDRAAGRRDLRSCARRRSARRMAGRLFPRRRQHPSRRRPARFALRARVGLAGGDRAWPAGHAGRDEALEPARARRSGVRDMRSNGRAAATPQAPSAISSATPTKASPARSRIACCSRHLRSAFSKAWRSPASPSARRMVSSICAANIATCSNR